MIRPIELRIPLGVGEDLHTEILRREHHERVAFALVSHVHLYDRDVLLVRHVLTLPESAYRPASGHGASWSGVAMIPTLQLATEEQLGIVLVHFHDHDGRPRLSEDDEATGSRLIPIFRARVASRPHGSVVLSRNAAAGVIYMPGEARPRTFIGVRWLGSAIIDWPSRGNKRKRQSADPDGARTFSRQALIVDGAGQRILSKARVAIVGLGGGGSHVAQQLAHAGIGHIVAIDPDRVADSNRHRLIGLTSRAVRRRALKVDVVHDLVMRIGLGTRCHRVPARVSDPESIQAISAADVIVGCVDNLHARADLQDIAWRFLIPYVDIGVSIRAVEGAPAESPRVAIGGNVMTLIPGGFCAWCCGFLTEEKLAAELAGPGRSYFQNTTGEAQVVSLNGLVASQAITEVLQLLTGFNGTGARRQDVADPRNPGQQRGYRKFNGATGTLEEWGAVRRPMCQFCASSLARGSIVWSEASAIGV